MTKIAPDGSQLLYATYFGNANTFPRSITVDADGNAYIAGNAGTLLSRVTRKAS